MARDNSFRISTIPRRRLQGGRPVDSVSTQVPSALAPDDAVRKLACSSVVPIRPDLGGASGYIAVERPCPWCLGFNGGKRGPILDRDPGPTLKPDSNRGGRTL